MDQIHVDKMKYPPLLTYDMEVLNIVGYDFQFTPKGYANNTLLLLAEI